MTAEPRRQRIRGHLRRRRLLPRPVLLRALTRLTESLPTSANQIDILFDGDELYRRMLADIRRARVRIHMEMYMFLADRTGWRFAHALASRARAGVTVRLVYDAVGCFGVSGRLFEFLARAGVETVEYHPIAPWRQRFAIFGRNHRKNVVIDGRVGYTGGANIGDLWLPRRRGGGGWLDIHARVEGPAAGDLDVLFDDTWHRETGVHLASPRLVPREPPHGPPESTECSSQVFVVGSRGGFRRSRAQRLYLLAIGRARRTVEITSPYFIPDRKMRRALRHARRRGVAVRLLLPEMSDIPIATYAARAYYRRLLARGVEIHLWSHSTLHGKGAVVDGEFSTVGSANFDNLSFTWNLESNLVALGATPARELSRQFERQFRLARHLTLEEWRRRSFLERLRERLASLLGRWL